MGFLRKTLRILSKTIGAVILVALMAMVVTSVTVIYNFEKPEPFNGPDIFNPYKELDTAYCWKKANFHVHTRVEGILNECDYWPAEVYEFHNRLGYDIVTFSNHNELTTHPFDSTLQVNVYEHGYNLFKYHKLVFGSKDVNRFDHLLPLFASQREFQLELLGRESDIIQFNHPLRTTCTTKRLMEKVSGYDIIELDCGKSTENEFWDWALSAGHYSFGLANDDLHFPDRTSKFARRCNFLCTPSARYEDIRATLLGGCYYSMRIPDYGKGNWDIKTEKNRQLPFVRDIELDKNTIYIQLSQRADSIKVFGQDHSTLLKITDSNSASYSMKDSDPYARFTVYFPGGEVIYSNPFARYDASVADSPGSKDGPSKDIPLTILFNTVLTALALLLVFTFYRTIIKR
ncbi:MAG: hypothetical protein J6V20_04780 [Bacteroidaceae bacterium]|nr:hypothetical protein [Bacteroidaceae bacterium]